MWVSTEGTECDPKAAREGGPKPHRQTVGEPELISAAGPHRDVQDFAALNAGASRSATCRTSHRLLSSVVDEVGKQRDLFQVRGTYPGEHRLADLDTRPGGVPDGARGPVRHGCR